MGSLLLVSVAGEFFAGLVIPIPLMPGWVQQLLYILPFRWTVDFPFRVYSGHIPPADAVHGIALQLLWLVVLVGTGWLMMRRALRQLVVQGG
jgi:ABC-2 type transport system permease protein